MKKMTETLYQQFNQPDTILVISKWPYKDIAKSHHGVATYTQHLVEKLSALRDKRFIILVQKEFDRPVEVKDRNILIIPAFDGNVAMFPQLILWILRFYKTQILHVHSEFFTSGQPLQMALVVPFLAILRMLGKKVYFTAHNVVDDFSFIANHLGKTQNNLLLKTLQKLTPLYYWSLSHVVEKIVVLDESVKQKLKKYVSKRNLLLSPHWVYPTTSERKIRKKWRTRLGYNDKDFVVMCFGFMTKYKGVDWLVDAVDNIHQKNPNSSIRLILAGGKAPSQEDKNHYQSFYNQLIKKVAQSPFIILTDFVQEKDVYGFFSASDLVILPYRGILGASGSWAQALAHGKPFLLSSELTAYLDNKEVKSALSDLGLDEQDLVFIRNKKTFTRHLHRTQKKLARIEVLSKTIAQDRSPEVRVQQEDLLMYTPKPKRVEWNHVFQPQKAFRLLFTN